MAVTPESFLELLEKSKLLSSEQLTAARGVAREVKSTDPRALAKVLVLKDLLTRWQAAKLLAGRSSFYIGKYKLIDQLGRGGMGGVFLVEHTMMNRTAALKVISRQLGKDPALLERFLTEARAIAALDHANIAHAYDVDKEGDRYYLVMEYIEGRDLQRMVEADGPLDCQAAADYVRQAADGLAHAHGKSLIHCDIKPANLLVSPQGVIKILDMGMARLMGHGHDGSDSEERVLGTVDYMAPEQAMDSPDLDHRVDIYSLGCTLYFLLTGRAPFPEGSIHQRIVKHQTQEPRPIDELRPDVPKDLADICRKMMAKEPADRYQTAEEVSRILAEWHPPSSQKLKRAVPLDAADAAASPKESKKSNASREPKGTKGPKESKDAKESRGAKEPEEPDESKGLGDLEQLLPVVDRPISRRSKKKSKSAAPLEKLGPLVGSIKASARKAVALLANRRRAAWAGGIGVALLLVIVGLVWVLAGRSRPSEQAVASRQGANAETKADSAAKQASAPALAAKEGGKGTEAAAAADKKPASAEAKATLAGKEGKAAPGGDKPSNDKPSNDKPSNDKAMKDASKPADKNGKAAGKPSEQPAGKAAEKTAGKAPEKAAEKTAEKAADKPKNDSKADASPGKKPDNAKSESPKAESAAKPKQPAPPADPFKGFPTAVELPAEGGSLGRIHTPANVAWDLDLENGDKVFRGNRQFTKPESKDEGGKPVWIVQLSTASASKDKEATLLDIAKFSRDGESLEFQWMEGVPTALAGYLRLCTLKVRAGGREHSVALLKPQIVEALPLNLDRMTTAAKIAVPWLPESSRTLVQFLKVEGVKDCAFSSQDPVPLGKKKLTLSFTYRDARTKAERVGLELTLLVGAKGGNLNFTTQLPRSLTDVLPKSVAQNPSYRMDLPKFFKFATQDPNVRIEWGRRVQEWNQSLEKPGNLKPQQQQETELKADVTGQQVWLIDLYTASKSAKIHFRVLADVGDQPVEVANSGVSPDAKK